MQQKEKQMHQGCSGSFENGKQVVDKVRMMGFAGQNMPAPVKLVCENCETEFWMMTFESQCPECGMVYGVTPCHAFDAKNVQAAGQNY